MRRSMRERCGWRFPCEVFANDIQGLQSCIDTKQNAVFTMHSRPRVPDVGSLPPQPPDSFRYPALTIMDISPVTPFLCSKPPSLCKGNWSQE